MPPTTKWDVLDLHRVNCGIHGGVWRAAIDP